MGENKEIKQNWTGPINFEIFFYVMFSCYGQSPISEKEAGHWLCLQPAFTFS